MRRLFILLILTSVAMGMVGVYQYQNTMELDRMSHALNGSDKASRWKRLESRLEECCSTCRYSDFSQCDIRKEETPQAPTIGSILVSMNSEHIMNNEMRKPMYESLSYEATIHGVHHKYEDIYRKVFGTITYAIKQCALLVVVIVYCICFGGFLPDSVCGKHLEKDRNLLSFEERMSEIRKIEAHKEKSYLLACVKECSSSYLSQAANHLRSLITYTVLQSSYSYMQRLASFRPISDQKMAVSLITLSESGFEYKVQDRLIVCSGCGSTVDLQSLISRPSEAQYHMQDCQFIIPLDAKPCWRDSGIDMGTSGKEAVLSNGSRDGTMEHGDNPELPHINEDNESDDSVAGAGLVAGAGAMAGADPVAGAGPVFGADSVAGAGPGHVTGMSSGSVDKRTSRPPTSTKPASAPPAPRTALEVLKNELLESITRERSNSTNTSGQSHLSISSRYSSESDTEHVPVPCFNFAEHYTPEVDDSSKSKLHKSSVSVDEIKCSKNQGHYAFYQMSVLKLKYLPSVIRSGEVLNFIKHLGKLVVRIVVNCGSLSLQKKVGTGMIVLDKDLVPDYIGENICSHSSDSRQTKLKLLKSMVTKKKIRGEIYIQTNRHVIPTNKEASQATVDFFFDHSNKKEVTKVKGLRVIHSLIPWDLSSILVCKTGDLDLLSKISKAKQEVLLLEGNMPVKYKEGMSKKVLLLSHPHGTELTLSQGDVKSIKYSVQTQENGAPPAKLVKLGQYNAVEDVRNMCKGLVYTADTCVGCSGAPIITYTKVRSVTGESHHYRLDVWMHNGTEINGRLNASVLKSCTYEEIEAFKNPVPPSVTQASGMGNEDGESGTSMLPSLSINSVVYPFYAQYTSRLDSFEGWPVDHIHKPEDLAFGGFHYAGYSDCVRCFYCGVGLRTWRPGDNMYREHQKHRESCHYLQTQLKIYGDSLLTSSPPLALKTDSQSADMACLIESSGVGETSTQTENCNKPNNSSETKEITNSPIKRKSQEKQEVQLEYVEHAANSEHSDTKLYTSANPVVTSTTQTLITLLQRENKALQQLGLCKVCHHRPIKDLLLPCGELCVCTECSHILSHCPVCKDKIHASLQIFFS